jgi:DNA-binding MarR family transcriptional regulator
MAAAKGKSGKASAAAAGANVPPSGLEDHLGYWLRFVSNHVSLGFRRKVEATGVTVAEWVLMRELYRLGPVAPSELAHAMAMTRGAVSRLVDRLEAKHLLKRSASAEDRRYQSVELSAAGARRVPALAALADANDAQFFGHLEPALRQQLAETLQGLARLHQFKELPLD